MKSIKKFSAIRINCTDEDDVLTIGVGDDENDPDNFFFISRFDEDDIPVDEYIGFLSATTDYEIADAIESATLTIGELVRFSQNAHAPGKIPAAVRVSQRNISSCLIQRECKAFVVNARRFHNQMNATGAAVLQTQPAKNINRRAAVIFDLFCPNTSLYAVIKHAEIKGVFTYVYAYRKHHHSPLTVTVTPVRLVHTESCSR